MKYFIANLKMYLSLKQTLSLVKKVRKSLWSLPASFIDKRLKNVAIVICPSFTAIEEVGAAVRKPYKLQATSYKLNLGAQDVFWKENHYTSQISARMLREIGVKYVIIGHSERRALGEKDKEINKKVKAALEYGLCPILCLGESLAQRKKGSQNLKVGRQLKQGLTGIKRSQLSKIIIAYEPIWAIGTGQECEPAEVEEMIRFIKGKKPGVRVLYGGSVDAENISSFLEKKVIDGVLVGSSSTKADEFIKMLKCF